MAAYRHVDYANRATHMWLGAFGQPMQNAIWDDDWAIGAQPGYGHFWRDLVTAHFIGVEKVSYFNYRQALFVNRHKDNTALGSPISLLSDMGRNTSETLTTEEEERHERTWARLKAAVADYVAGPGVVPLNSDNQGGVENPYLIVAPDGQSATRLDSSTL